MNFRLITGVYPDVWRIEVQKEDKWVNIGIVGINEFNASIFNNLTEYLHSQFEVICRDYIRKTKHVEGIVLFTATEEDLK